jgi:uncharacterized protein YkwD
MRHNGRNPVYQGVVLGLTILTACGGNGPVDPPGPAGDSEIQRFVDLVDAYRQSVNCPSLTWSSALAGVAQEHSNDMVDRSYFSHTDPDGQSPGDRLNASGVSWSAWAENIAAGQPTAEAVLEAWLGSPGHRANIENCSLTQHGVGLRSLHWTHLFVRP